MEVLQVEIYGHAEELLCASCAEGDCGSCEPGEKRKTSELIDEFTRIVASGPLAGKIETAFYEATDFNIERHPDVKRLLSMASLTPIIVVDGKVTFLGGFDPAGLVAELEKKLA